MISPSYVPILLTRRGELSAAADLPVDVQHHLTPLFVVHPIGTDFDTNTPSRSVAEHVRGLGTRLARSWPASRAFIDPFFTIDLSDHTGGLRTIVDEAAAEGLTLAPVIAHGRPGAYAATVAALLKRDKAGVCVRLPPRHWPTTPDAVYDLEVLLGGVRASLEEVDLILDLGEEAVSELAIDAASSAVQGLPYQSRWHSVTLAGAAFPRELGKLPKGRISRILRTDWQLYRKIAEHAAVSGYRVPIFGDYAIAHPDPRLQVDPRMMSIGGTLRYTSDGDFLVAKGTELFKGPRGIGGEAIRPAARMLAGAKEFCGPSFSEGDAWIYHVARGQARCGNPERWRRTATNHHLTFVIDQLASQHAS